MNNICPVENRATRTSIEPFLNGHDIQQQQPVGESRKIEAVKPAKFAKK
jgi:hypothetical protein